MIPVEIDNIVHTVYVLKRPHVEEFLETVAKQYELVVFTASLSKVSLKDTVFFLILVLYSMRILYLIYLILNVSSNIAYFENRVHI